MSEENDPTQPEQPEPSGVLGGLPADELFARALHTVKMTGGAHMWEPPSVEEAAALFPGYAVVRLLGRGGMGAVYQAKQIELDRDVAVKLLPLEVSADPDFVARFRREARAMARLHHPNIISVHDFGTTPEGHLFFAMEYVEGANLHDIIHSSVLNGDQALSITEQVCTALAYAHGKGIVHRDIKPANVMLDTARHVKVADFGLARLDEPAAGTGTTVTGLVMGTPDYMAPEQMRGMNVDHRADIYSTGVMLYEMLCREVPKGVFQPPSHRAGCDARIDEIVNFALQQAPEFRYQTAEEMLAAVSSVNRPPRPKPVAALAFPGAAAPPARMSRNQLLTRAALALAALGVLAFLFTGQKEETKPRKAVDDHGKKPLSAAEHPGVPAPAESTPNPPKPGNPPGAGLPQLAVNPVAATPAPAPATPAPAPVATPAPAPPATPAPDVPKAPPKPKTQSDVEKWLALTDGRVQSEVTAPFRSEIAKLQKTYLAALDRANAAASAALKPAEAAAYQNERQRIEEGSGVPDDDSDAPPDELKTLRARWRRDVAAREAERRKQETALFNGETYAKVLEKYKNQTFQLGRLDDALLLQQRREALAREWAVSAPSATTPQTGGLAALATTAKPFVNSLGMKFVPVPITGGPTNGQRVLFSIWDTRVQDYEVFAKEAKTEWPKPDFEQGPTHPAVMVSWVDAQSFCQWLTAKDRKAGKISSVESYRLPSDHEWSCAVGIGDREDPAKSPGEKNSKIDDVFPWGNDFPPRAKVGNYADEAKHEKFPNDRWFLGYNDGYATTSLVGSFPANAYGLYDMGGNVWQWCEDWWDASHRDRVRRGASWGNDDRDHLLSSFRQPNVPGFLFHDIGFRCVLAVSAPAAAAPANTPAPPNSPQPTATPAASLGASISMLFASKDRPFVNSLGMKFVPVPITGGPTSGQRVLFSIWDTRVHDYAAYARVQKVDATWTSPSLEGFEVNGKPEYPVVGVSREDAQNFCHWLTETDRRAGKILATESYRLPSDHEWSCAVGIGTRESAALPPGEKSGKIDDVFPWGKEWPPKGKVGNYKDEEAHAKYHFSDGWIEGYRDGFATTSPVGSFPPNAYGLFDMGGNVCQWVEDWLDAEHTAGVARGASFLHFRRQILLSSFRDRTGSGVRIGHFGFRCVLVASVHGAAAQTPAPANPSPGR